MELNMAKSYILTAEMARKALEIVTVAFEKLVALGVTDRNKLHIVIMDPAKRPEFGDTFEDAILYQQSIGEEVERYKKIALGKARVAWLYGLPTQEVQQFYPHLYTEGMTKWGGGTYLHHIAVGASGVEYQYDQWAAEMVASTCRALSVGKMAEALEIEKDFLE